MGKFKDIDVVDAIKAMKMHIEHGRMSSSTVIIR